MTEPGRISPQLQRPYAIWYGVRVTASVEYGTTLLLFYKDLKLPLAPFLGMLIDKDALGAPQQLKDYGPWPMKDQNAVRKVTVQPVEDPWDAAVLIQVGAGLHYRCYSAAGTEELVKEFEAKGWTCGSEEVGDRDSGDDAAGDAAGETVDAGLPPSDAEADSP